jgi:FMN-dependent oxidoreductase (nitrilotriacetate monooxygenase family)
LAALAMVTEHVGLIGTASTTFNHPYTVARQFNMLDIISAGRAAWNIVTSFAGNENYGIVEMPAAETRYRQAHEFVEVAKQLWESWDEDALITDRASGRLVDAAKLHRIDHHGEFFSIAGPLTTPRSPQTGPVLVQAGSSGPGVDLGASYAELVYTVQPDRQRSIEFYATYKDAVVAKGREADDVNLLPGIIPIIGDTPAEAAELADELAGFVNLDAGRAMLERSLRIDLSDLDYDEPIPADRIDAANPTSATSTSRAATWIQRTVENGWTLRKLIVESRRGSGHHWTYGTAAQVADEMIDWFEARACDGWSLNAAYHPDGFDAITDKLVPLLQERGYFHGDYPGTTLRENIRAGRASA